MASDWRSPSASCSFTAPRSACEGHMRVPGKLGTSRIRSALQGGQQRRTSRSSFHVAQDSSPS